MKILRITEDEVMNIGEVIKNTRETLGIPIATYARAVGYSRQHIYNIENGTSIPKWNRVIILLNHLGYQVQLESRPLKKPYREMEVIEVDEHEV